MLKVQKISYSRFIFRKGRFLAYRDDTLAGLGGGLSNFIIHKTQRGFWPMVLENLLGAENSLPSFEAAILKGNQI